MERKRYCFIALIGQGKDKLFFESVRLDDTVTVGYVPTPEKAVSFSSEERAMNYVRKYLVPFVNPFNVRIVSEWGDFSRNECLLSDIRGGKEDE